MYIHSLILIDLLKADHWLAGVEEERGGSVLCGA